MGDEWEALFQIWHERAHENEKWYREGAALKRRIVKLEAYVMARRLEASERAKAKGKGKAWEFANVISGTIDLSEE